MMKKIIILIGLIISFPSFSAFQCGGYKLTLTDSEGLVRVNREKVTSQKVRYLKKEGDEANTAWDMGLMPASDGNNYGFEFVKRNGKAFLNVQLLQANMDIPPIIGSFPCKKVPD